jgi:putative membrane protein
MMIQPPREPTRHDLWMGSGSASSNEPAETDPDVRFSYANERTFLAWIRTALGLVTAGLAITELLPPFDVAGGRRIIGLPLIALGVLIAVASLATWRANERAMRRGEPIPRSPIPAITAIVVSLVAVAGFLLVVFAGSSK